MKSAGLSVVVMFLSIASGPGANAQQTAATGYHVVQKLALGGDGGWDYLTVDSAARRLYISRSTRVLVVDAESGKAVGEIPGTEGVHGIALVGELGRGFTSNGRSSTVTVFDLRTLAATAQIPVGKNPDAIIYDAFSGRVFTCNGASHDATAIDAKTATVAGTVALDGRPEFAVADGKGRIFVNLEDRSQVVAFDARTLQIAGRWPLAPGEEPTGLAMDLKHRRLFAGCHNQLMVVMDADSGRVVTTLPIGSGVDATAFDPDRALAFASNGDGTLTVVHEDSPEKFTVVENVATQRGARTMALDAGTHRIFLPTAEFGPPPSPTAERPHPRPSIVPGTFTVLVVGK